MIRQLVVITILIAQIEKTATSCECMLQSAEEGIRDAKIIFEGVVIDVSKRKGMNGLIEGDMTTIQVNRRWHGIGAQQQTVKILSSESGCDYRFRKGTDYLIFARGDP